jgi:hypothetical protein
MKSFTLDTIVFNNDTGAANDLSGVALLVDLAQSSPSTKDLGVTDLDQIDLVFGTEGLNQLDILGLSAGFYENAEMGGAFVKGLGAFTQATSQPVVDEGIFQDLLWSKYQIELDQWRFLAHLECVLYGQFSFGSIGRGDLDLSLSGIDGNVISSVRHTKHIGLTMYGAADSALTLFMSYNRKLQGMSSSAIVDVREK